MSDVKRGVEFIVRSVGDITSGVEAVRKTVVNLDKSSVPSIFIIELPSESDDTTGTGTGAATGSGLSSGGT